MVNRFRYWVVSGIVFSNATRFPQLESVMSIWTNTAREDLMEAYEPRLESLEGGHFHRFFHAYHKMAVNAGIEMSECKLFEGK